MSGLFRSTAVLAALSILPACGNKQESDVEVAADASVPRYSAAQFFETTSYLLVPAGGHAFSPDGESLLMSSDQTGVFNAYELPVAGGDARPLTNSGSAAIFGVSWFPNDRRILYTFDNGGDELNHVVVRETDGSVRDLTPGENLKAEFLGWLDDGSAFFLTTTERNQRSFDVYRYAADGYARELVFENPGFGVAAISGDGRWLALDKPRTSADSDIYIVDLAAASPSPRLVTEHEGNVEHGSLGFTPDNKHLLYATDELGEFREAWRFDLETGEKARVFAAAWDVWEVSYSPDGRYRVTVVNADSRTDVTMTDATTGAEVRLPGLPSGDVDNIRFDNGGDRLALIVTADTSPANIHVVDLAAGTSRQLTDALNPDIDPSYLVDTTIVRYKSFDGLEIPGVLYKPLQASADNPVPALVYVHGGPGGQSRQSYNPTIQHLANHGYAVLAANNRGSSGYGKTFYHLDDRRHGEEDLQDIVYARNYLESLDWVDGERVGIIGGSYGGYMVAAALAFEPEAFDVGINIFGVTNWVRTLESIPPWWEDFKEALYDEMGDPATDAERHRRISPLFHADNIVKPLLVVQGANDPRVLQTESDELVAAVQANEVPVEYVLFPDEGHGFRRRENRITASEAYVEFLDTYLAE